MGNSQMEGEKTERVLKPFLQIFTLGWDYSPLTFSFEEVVLIILSTLPGTVPNTGAINFPVVSLDM